MIISFFVRGLLLSYIFFSFTTIVFADKIQTKEMLETTIKKYILENPQIIIESLYNYEERLKKQENNKISNLIKKHSDALFNDSHSVILGNKEGKIKIAYFHDYRCGYCKKSWPNLEDLVKKNDDLAIIVKDIPILGEASENATRLALAATKQNKQEELSIALIKHKGSWAQVKLLQIAKGLKLDIQQLNHDAKSKEVEDQINQNLKLAQILNILGTPVFVLENEVIEGAVSFSQLQSSVKKIRDQKKLGSYKTNH